MSKIKKNNTFNELRTNDPIVYFQGKEFVGSFYEVGSDKYLFVGVDKRLLSFSGFIDFNDYPDDSDTFIEKNYYFLFKDGVLIIEIEQIQEFSDIIRINEIENYQDKITVSDIDEMNEYSFSKYFIHLLKRNGFTQIREEEKIGVYRVDLIASFNNTTYYFEFKIYKSKTLSRSDIEQVNIYSRNISNENFVLVTNAVIDNENVEYLNTTIIDRNGLKMISKNYRTLIELIKTSPNNL